MKILAVGIVEESVNSFLKLQLEALHELGHDIMIVGGITVTYPPFHRSTIQHSGKAINFQ